MSALKNTYILDETNKGGGETTEASRRGSGRWQTRRVARKMGRKRGEKDGEEAGRERKRGEKEEEGSKERRGPNETGKRRPGEQNRRPAARARVLLVCFFFFFWCVCACVRACVRVWRETQTDGPARARAHVCMRVLLAC